MERIMANRKSPLETPSTFTPTIEEFLTPTSKGTFALFNYVPKDGEAVKVTELDNGDKSRLAMSGVLRLDESGFEDLQVQVAGFGREQKDYLDLLIQTRPPIDHESGEVDREAERVKYTGRLWNERRKEGGKRSATAPDYTGYITVLPVLHKGQYSAEAWEDAPRLQVVGYVRRNANSTARIDFRFHSQHVAENELAF
jgi:hypothetical protein